MLPSNRSFAELRLNSLNWPRPQPPGLSFADHQSVAAGAVARPPFFVFRLIRLLRRDSKCHPTARAKRDREEFMSAPLSRPRPRVVGLVPQGAGRPWSE